MKVVLFCGGMGTRIREASEALPKPLISVHGYPIIFYLMCQYAKAGHTDFILCGGFKINKIYDYVKDLSDNMVDYGFDIAKWKNNGFVAPSSWSVQVKDTGSCCIGERLWRVQDLVKSDDYFFANYSDCISDLDVNKSFKLLKNTGGICCFTAVRPSQSYHWVDFSKDNNGLISGLRESNELDLWVNGGFMCLTPQIFEFMNCGEELVIEPFKRLAKIGKLVADKYSGFWKSIDTYKDLLESESALLNNNYSLLS